MTTFAPFSAHWPRFIALLNERTGLLVREKDRITVLAALETRRKAVGISRPDAYLELLESDRDNREWRHLLPLLTNGESYFLRDSRQFSLLRHTIFPELMNSRSQQHQLRVWSAGCSTGEEVYSLAMLADEVAPRNQGWKVQIIGTDINEMALQKAQNGIYNQWSFRGVSEDIREKYFQKVGTAWKINERLRGLVTFRTLNLRSPDYPDRNNGLYDMDLILCRNVLIYLSPQAVTHVLRGFTGTLREGGFLLTGHAELAHHAMALKPRIFPESVVYQKRISSDTQTESSPTVELTVPKSSSTLSRPVFTTRAPVSGTSKTSPLRTTDTSALDRSQETQTTKIRSRLPNSKPSETITEAPKLDTTSLDTKRVSNLCELARREANLGRHPQALEAIREAVTIDPVNPDAYALWAQVASEQGDNEEAKRLWKKVVFLVPSRIDAWLDLGELYAATGDAIRARRMRQTALELLQALPSDSIVPHSANAKAEELASHISRLLGNE